MDTPNIVTYYFENGTKQICAINEKILYNMKGNRKSWAEIASLFADTAHDIGAERFEV